MRALIIRFFLLWCLSFSLAQAQPQADGWADGEALLSIPDKLGAIERSLAALQQTLSYHKEVKEISGEIKNFVFFEDFAATKIKELEPSESVAVTTKQVKKVKQDYQTITVWQEIIVLRKQTLDDAQSELNKTKVLVKSVNQLLSNPINLTDVARAQAEIKRLDAIGFKISELSQDLVIQQGEVVALSEQLTAILVRVGRLRAKLAKVLAVQQQASNQTLIDKPQLSLVKKKLENDLENLEDKLQNQSDNMRVADIEKIQQQINNTKNQLWLLELDAVLIDIVRHINVAAGFSNAEETVPLTTLEEQQEILVSLKTALNQLKKNLGEQFEVFQKMVDVTGIQPDLDDAFTQRMKSIEYQYLILEKQIPILNNIIANKKRMLLLHRYDFYSQRQQAWNGIKGSLVQITYQIIISFRTLYRSVIEKPLKTMVVIVLAIMVQIGMFKLMASWMRQGIQKYNDDTGLVAMLGKVSIVIKKYLYIFVFLLFILTLVDVTEIPYPSWNIIYILVCVIAFGLMWWELVQIEVKLGNLSKYNGLYNNGVMLILLLFALLYALAYQSAVAAPVVNLYEKFLMLALAGFAWVMRNNFSIYLMRQKKHINDKAYLSYLFLLNILPVLVVGVCLIGVAGYSHLAWLILTYGGTALLFFLVLNLGMATINGMRKKAKLYSIKHFKHGAFIAQDIVSPLSMITKGLWALIIARVWFVLQNWDSNSYFVAGFLRIAQYPILTIGSTAISMQMIGLLVLSVYLVFRVARWLKTFSYHWLYAGIGDLGVRNSLSIFSQYITVLIGVLIALNVLGIDLTSLAVFAGALGVGIGLGLQDIAKNFISGILLLIERPLRSGDWVAIDGMEGTVKSIGMRAITMETFDKQEVIIPNGNAISNSFTNYTHSNSITRAVLYVGAAYDCPPSKVLAVLNEVIAHVDEILQEPEPAIILWEYADSSINYRIQYYVNLDDSSLFALKTTVLNNIWEAFAEHNIEIPFPQRDIRFRTELVSAPSVDKETMASITEKKPVGMMDEE